jgi:hypothetical protein
VGQHAGTVDQHKTEWGVTMVRNLHSARKKAFLKKLPVAISENGITILLYPDGSRKPYTKRALQALRHAQA